MDLTYSVRKLSFLRLEFLVALLAAIIAVNSQFAAFTDHYVINGDVFESIYWMPQFSDSALFRNDLLTEYSKHYQSPWGFFLFYRALAVFIDPFSISRVLPIILFVFSVLYLFKLVRHFADNFTALVAALVFMVMPFFLATMVGGYARAFAFPLLIPFVYYLIKREYAKASLLMLLQALFYPMIFLVAALTYLFTFINIRHYKLSFDRQLSKAVYFILAVAVSGAFLAAKYVFVPNPSIGTIATRSQMLNRPEFGEHGRADVLHTPSLPKAIFELSTSIAEGLIKRYPTGVRRINKAVLNIQTVPIIILSLLLLVGFILALEIIKGKVFVPKEFLYLFVSSAIMYVVADALLFRLYQPLRYILYTIPLIALIVGAVIVTHLIAQVRPIWMKATLSALLILVIGLHFNINKGIGLKDYGSAYYHQSGLSNSILPINKGLYAYLNTLPKDAVIAAQPYLADGIPTFAQRKVLINFELSHPFYDHYWETIKNRTIDFFQAYYAHDCLTVRQFSDKYHIDYFVVDKRHFEKAYLDEGKMYFEPFNSFVKTLVQRTDDYVLLDISDQDKLFKAGDVFVFDAKLLAHKCPSGLINHPSEPKVAAIEHLN